MTAEVRRVSGTAPERQRELLAQALGDAVAYRRPEGPCSDCEEQRALCGDHAADLARSLGYVDLATFLGITLEC